MEIRFPLILDGATGTELQKRGYTGESCAEQLNRKLSCVTKLTNSESW